MNKPTIFRPYRIHPEQLTGDMRAIPQAEHKPRSLENWRSMSVTEIAAENQNVAAYIDQLETIQVKYHKLIEAIGRELL